MSASRWDWSPASADGLLTNEECSMLLDVDIFDDDLLKTFPTAAAKIEPSKFGAEEISSSLYPPSPPEHKPSQAELAFDLLQQIETSCKQENIFPNWLEEKVELPIFENIPQEHERGVAVVPNLAAYVPAPLAPPAPPAPPAPVQQPPTEELLREFETVYGAVELTHLTPPQSPPGPATQLLLSYAQQAQCAPLVPLTTLHAPEPWALQQPAYDGGYQEVDDILAHRAAELASPAPSAGSYTASPPSSPHSSCTDADEEWSAPSSSSGRGKPYARGPDDRRSRKKEQNKNAATRYRQKKKAEIEVLLCEEAALRARHGELGEKCSDLQREIRYLKGLMRDLFKAKGLIK